MSYASSIETTIDFTAWMKQALRLAERGRGFTRINPLVGAIVLDRDGNKAGEGFHAVVGGPHAEVMAIQAAGPRARGGTLILNLEPCCHHGRTGPCTDAIREAGLARVVFSHRDPDPRVSGMGARILTKSGIEVLEGIEADNARELNASYLLNKLQGRPFVTVKLALSLDGRTADSAGYSKWITGPQCRLHAHALRARHDAIVVGAETARRDDPLLTVRDLDLPSPQRFVLVGRHELSPSLSMFTGERPAVRVGAIAGSADWVVPGEAGLPRVRAFLDRLFQAEYGSLLVEGGARLAGSFLSAGCVDRVVLYFGPLLLGGGRGAFDGFSRDLTNAVRFSRWSIQTLDDGFVVTGYPEED